MDAVKKSLIGLHITMVLLGGTALFSQVIGLPALNITLGRSIFACVVLACIVAVRKEGFGLASTKDYLIALILGSLMAAHWATYFAAMQYAGVSVGIIALFTFPVITVFLEPVFESRRLYWQDALSAIVVLIGIMLVVPTPDLNNQITLGVSVGVVSAVLYSLRNLAHRRYFSHYSGIKAMAWQTAVICLVLSPFASGELVTASHQDWLKLLLLGTIFTALPHALIAHSLKHLRAATFSLIASMQPFYGVILSIIILKESPTLSTIIGGLLVTSAAIYETVITHKSTS